MSRSPLVSKGQVWSAYDGRVLIDVTRVARDGSWADIHCFAPGDEWTKRQPLRGGVFPFAATFQPYLLVPLPEVDGQEA